ncbi:MAG: ubiquinone/menaquinone biosynthesis methyltransferase [bacterium]|nr:ubiquinone/menaquinone biosynthesis methyltransferase [bacterium]
MSQQVKEIFDSIAPKYDLLNTLLSFSVDKHWRRQAVRELAQRQCYRVLDLCAGTLSMTLELLKQNPDVQIEAVDFSQQMLERGLKRIPPPLRSHIDLLCADGLSLPFPEKAFDGAMCAYGLRNLYDNKRGLLVLKRFIKPGATLVILEFFLPDRFVTRLFHATYAQGVIPIVGRLISQRKDAYSYLKNSVKGFYSVTEYKKLLNECGYQQIQSRSLTGGISTLITATVP